MLKIIGISGSLRKGSSNTSLLRAAAEVTAEGSVLEVASIKGIPLYNGDIEETGGTPAVVEELKNQIAESDGLLLVTPEYNNSMPGVLKNAIDWLSRPSEDIPRVFKNRPVGLMGATPGQRGTILAQTAWLPVIRTLGMRPWFGMQLYVSRADKMFDCSGRLVDEAMQKRLRAYMKGFVEFIQKINACW